MPPEPPEARPGGPGRELSDTRFQREDSGSFGHAGDATLQNGLGPGPAGPRDSATGILISAMAAAFESPGRMGGDGTADHCRGKAAACMRQCLGRRPGKPSEPE